MIASFPQHTSRDNDPHLHVHNAILNRVLREDPLASRPGDRKTWRTLDGAALYAAKPAAGAIAERSLAEYLSGRLGVETVARPDGNGWEITGISGELREQFSSRRRTIGPRLCELIGEYERKHGKAPNARAVWSMAQFVTLDSRQAKAHSAPSREALLAQWEAQSRRAETDALSAVPDTVLGQRDTGTTPQRLSGADIERILTAAVADAQQRKATFSRYELTRMVNGGAKILLTGDPEQLSAPQADGAMKLLAGEHGYYQLHTIQRFEHEWEREASRRLRSGDADVLAEHDQRGRILEGAREQMADVAYQRWLADYLSGKDSMLLTTTNAQAAELARRARDELAALGLVSTGEVIELADGNEAGIGDLIVAWENARLYAGQPGRFLANRDVLRIDAWEERGEARVALVRRQAGRDPVTRELQWSAPFELPEDYLERHVQLAYAGDVHVAQSRTMDTAHLVVDEAAGRASFYVGMSRGRERNTAYVVTERPRAADLSPQPRPVPALEDPGAADDAARHLDRFSVLTEVLRRERGERTATETLRQELEHAASLATLASVWADVTRSHATRRYENELRGLLAPHEWQRYEQDAERGTLTRLLRAAELAGHDTANVLCRAVEGRDFAGARSIAAVLHSRVQWIVGTPEPRAAASYADRTPAIEDPEADQFARDLAAAMDERVTVLGNRTALDRPVWALQYLGEVPADPVQRAEWAERAGLVAAYRGGTRVRRRGRRHRSCTRPGVAGTAGKLARRQCRAGDA